ncbi:MAG: hypothetical protein BWY08_00813 [Bacteroidetes bacterium ADurb.Bin174]|jgi:hypothetical protein|nr:MAG: hypothetical protein BWY08_00813 [Bacteroidetes bacterium ADurb.Bin174]
MKEAVYFFRQLFLLHLQNIQSTTGIIIVIYAQRFNRYLQT